MDILSWILATILVILVALFFHLRRHRGFIEQLGLPIVKPFLCFGSPPYLYHKIFYYDWYKKKIEQLGKTFVRYDGVYPSIVTIDPEIIKEVTTKQFDNFMDVVEINFSPEQTTLDVSRYPL